MQGHNGQLTSSIHSKKLGEAVLPNVFVQNKPEPEKTDFSYESEPELFFHEPEPCQTGPKSVKVMGPDHTSSTL